MNIKNKPATFFGLLIITLVVYILYWSTTKPIDVVVQAGHEGRTHGNTGAVSKHYSEVKWNTLVADEVSKTLRSWNIEVKRVPAKVGIVRAKVAVAIHFDSAQTPCNSGASIGYPSMDSYDFAQKWKKHYKNYFPYQWHMDNFTKNLSDYYAYKWIRADKFLVLELGEITCDTQTKWLKPRLKKIAHLIAYAIAKELGKDVKKPLL
jgi:N-acetylmuramoyl-L-alanine amidase